MTDQEAWDTEFQAERAALMADTEDELLDEAATLMREREDDPTIFSNLHPYIIVGDQVRAWGKVVGTVLRMVTELFGVDGPYALVKVGESTAWILVEDLTVVPQVVGQCHGISVTGKRCVADNGHTDQHYNYGEDGFVNEHWATPSPLDSALALIEDALKVLTQTAKDLRDERYNYVGGTGKGQVEEVMISAKARTSISAIGRKLYTAEECIAAFENQEYI